MSRNLLIVFLKNPIPGQVKTRLATTVGNDEAARIYRELVLAVFGNLKGIDADVEIHFEPAGAEPEIRDWLAPLLGEANVRARYSSQLGGDLGERLSNVISRSFEAGYQKVAAIGTDCPDIAPPILEETWDALDHDDVVLGPTHDGGYYLIGLREHQPRLFRRIPWSTEAVFRTTLDAARVQGLSVHQLPILSDIDTEEDWVARPFSS